MKKNFLIPIIFLFFTADFVQAAAIKVFPSEVKIKTESGVLAKGEITVENPTEDITLYEVYADDFSDWILPKPESFFLKAREKQRVVLEIKNKDKGVFLTYLSVVAKPLSERKFKIDSGVKIPLEIRISEGEEGFLLAKISQNFIDFLKSKNSIYIIILVLIAAAAGVWIKIVKKNKNIRE
ncbi:MAG: hypothetical protein ABH813_00255 [Patescibacteria group bacterium]